MRPGISPEPAILGFLLERPVHGYDLYKQVNRQLGVAWRVGLSQLYAIVKTYESRGWIAATVRSQTSRPSQRVLQVTPAGRRAFADWLGEPAHGLRELRVDFFLRLYFARAAGPQAASRLLERQVAGCRRELTSLKAQQGQAGSSQDDLGRLAQNFRVHQLLAIIRWLETHRNEMCGLTGSTKTLSVSRVHRSGSRRTRTKTVIEEEKK